MEQMTMKHNETGRTMIETLGALAVMGVLSLTAVAGITYAMRRQAVVETVDLINKSTTGIVTSNVLSTLGDDLNAPSAVSTQQISLSAYMSDRSHASAAEKIKYGDETFVGPRGSVFSAYPSAVQGGGFLLAVNNMQSAVCEDVLSYDLEYDAVVRVDDNGQPDGIFVVAIHLDDAQNRKDFCQSEGDEELNVGFVFNADVDTNGNGAVPPPPNCNSDCAVEAFGECVLTKTERCTGANSNRKYYNLDHCACLCLDPLNMDSDCNCQNNLVWDGNTKKCVQCLDNSHCSGNTPVCDVDTNTCKACPSGEFMANDGTCYSCSISSGYSTTAEECAKCDDTTTPRTMYGAYCGLKSCSSGQFMDTSSGTCRFCATLYHYSTTAEECAKCDDTSTPRVMRGSYCGIR